MFFCDPSFAKNRIALVIGNNAYQNVQPLDRAVNDADAISQTLEETEFDVIRANNVNRLTFNQKVAEFVSRIQPGDVAMFYYAGHGIEINGQNYLLPTDIPKAEQGEFLIQEQSVSLHTILTGINQKKARLNIVMLDACRDNPFTSLGERSIGGTRGLARTTAPNGTYILYSAGAGQTALDHLGAGDNNPNSVFTRSLIPLMRKPGIEFVDLAQKVRTQVSKLARTIQHQQNPAYYDEAEGKFYFTPPTTPEIVKVSTPQTQRSHEITYWESIKDSNNIAYFEAYLQDFPSGSFVRLANLKINELSKSINVPQSSKDPNPSAVIVKPETSPQDKLQLLIQKCEKHFRATELTSGKSGNAYDCYRNVLKIDRNNKEALSGIKNIERKYVRLINKEINLNNHQKAMLYLVGLKRINPNHPNAQLFLDEITNLRN